MGVYPVGSVVELSNERLAIVNEINEADQKSPIVKVIYNTQYKRYVKIELLDLAKNKDVSIVKPVDPTSFGIQVNDFLI